MDQENETTVIPIVLIAITVTTEETVVIAGMIRLSNHPRRREASRRFPLRQTAMSC